MTECEKLLEALIEELRELAADWDHRPNENSAFPFDLEKADFQNECSARLLEILDSYNK